MLLSGKFYIVKCILLVYISYIVSVQTCTLFCCSISQLQRPANNFLFLCIKIIIFLFLIYWYSQNLETKIVLKFGKCLVVVMSFDTVLM